MPPEKPSDLFPARLRAARELRQFSQTGLAQKAGLPPTSISHFEGGSRKPSFDNLRILADTLNVSADFLLGRVDKPEAHAGGADTFHRHAQKLAGDDLDLAADFVRLLQDRNKKRR